MKDSGSAYKRVLVYIDYENIHTILRKKYTNLIKEGFFEKFKNWCDKKNLQVLDIVAYGNFDIADLHESYHQTKLQEYGIQTIHTSNKGKNYAEFKISIDVMEQLYIRDNIDGIIIISSDKDLYSLVKSIKKHKEVVYWLTTENDFDESIVFSFSDEHIYLKDIFTETSEIRILNNKEDILESLDTFVSTQFNKYKGSKGQARIFEPHIAVDRYVKDTSSYRKLFRYDFAYLLKLLEDDNKIYVYNSSRFKAIITSDQLEAFKNENLLEDKDIVQNYFNQTYINNIYDEYNRKQKV